MQFKEGASVYTAAGDKVGAIDRVVIEPDTKEVTHLVVRKGFLFKKDKVVPMSLVGPATEDRIVLRENAGDMENLDDFEESQYVMSDSETRHAPSPPPGKEGPLRPLYWYPPLGTWWAGRRYPFYPEPKYILKKKRNIPEGTIPLEEGAQVISSDGEHIGDIERVFTDPQEDRATHFLISEGLILKEKKLIPTKWISNILEDQVHMIVDSHLLDNLPDYQI